MPHIVLQYFIYFAIWDSSTPMSLNAHSEVVIKQILNFTKCLKLKTHIYLNLAKVPFLLITYKL